MRSGRQAVFSALALVGLAASTAEAGQFLVYNTGVDASGVLLAGGSLDLDYTLVLPSGLTAPATVGTNIPNSWLGNDANSKWIGPGANLTTTRPTGTYIYRTTFDLTGFNPATASITGGLATDNNGQVFLNGVSTGITSQGFSLLTSFSITSGFVAGLNTLEFQVVNLPGSGNNPTGLRVDNLIGTAVAVPEPTTVVTLGIAGLSLLGLVRRRNAAIA